MELESTCHYSVHDYGRKSSSFAYQLTLSDMLLQNSVIYPCIRHEIVLPIITED